VAREEKEKEKGSKKNEQEQKTSKNNVPPLGLEPRSFG
jgi:hypothetical protein